MNQEKPYHTILSFPDDEIERIVWWYGPIFIKNSTRTTAPEVEVLLRTAKQGLVKKPNKFYVYKVPLSELSIVRIGSHWKGQKSLGKMEQESIKTEFEFDLSGYAPKYIKTFGKDNDEYVIPHEKYSFAHPFPQNNNRYKTHFGSSILTKLTTLNGVSVLIPSLEVLTSMYTPNEMDIRRKLITQDFKAVLKDYINISKSKLLNGNTYSIHFTSQKDKPNSVFLAHLALNHTTRSRVSKIWSDLQTQSKDRYEERYPSIPPYHSGGLKISVNGIWLDNNETFLVFRVNATSLPQEMDIQRTIEIYGESNTDDETPSSKTVRKSIVSPSLPITGYSDPNSNAGIARTRSQVSVITDNDFDHPIIEDIIIIAPPSNSNSIQTNKEVPEQLSSGEGNSSSSNRRVAKIKQTEVIEDIQDHSYIDQTQVISLVNSAIVELNNNDFISKVTYIDENGNESPNFRLAAFPNSLVNQGKIGTWPLTFEGSSRRCLIVKLELSTNKILFLLEIERKSENEAFSGLIFTHQLLSLPYQAISSLMKAIATNKGIYKKYSPEGAMRLLNITLDKYLIFNHSLIKNSMTNKIQSVIREATKELFP